MPSIMYVFARQRRYWRDGGIKSGRLPPELREFTMSYRVRGQTVENLSVCMSRRHEMVGHGADGAEIGGLDP